MIISLPYCFDEAVDEFAQSKEVINLAETTGIEVDVLPEEGDA